MNNHMYFLHSLLPPHGVFLRSLFNIFGVASFTAPPLMVSLTSRNAPAFLFPGPSEDLLAVLRNWRSGVFDFGVTQVKFYASKSTAARAAATRLTNARTRRCSGWVS